MPLVVKLAGGITLKPKEEVLIRKTIPAEHPVVTITRELGDGHSMARVFEARLREAVPGTRDFLAIIKLDRLASVENENFFSSQFQGRAASFLKIRNSEVQGDRGCLLYEHANDQYEGEIISLESACYKAFRNGDDHAFQRFIVYTGGVLGIVRTQLQRYKGSCGGAEHLDHYLRSWWPWARISVTKAQEVESAVELIRSDIEDIKSSEEIKMGVPLGRGDFGRQVYFATTWIEFLEKRIFIGDAHRAYCEVLGLDDVEREKLRAAAQNQSSGAIETQVFGVLYDRGREDEHAGYHLRLEEAGLPAEEASWTFGGIVLANPWQQLYENAWKWAERETEHTFGHGDLHGRNVLCMGEDGPPVIIDHAKFGPKRSLYADAARLIGSLWRNAIACQLKKDEVDEILAQFFEDRPISGHNAKGDRAVQFLRGTIAQLFRKEPSCARSASFWIDLHHFCWTALKWKGDSVQHRAMALLAAVAAQFAERHLVLAKMQEEGKAFLEESHERLKFIHSQMENLRRGRIFDTEAVSRIGADLASVARDLQFHNATVLQHADSVYKAADKLHEMRGDHWYSWAIMATQQAEMTKTEEEKLALHELARERFAKAVQLEQDNFEIQSKAGFHLAAYLDSISKDLNFLEKMHTLRKQAVDVLERANQLDERVFEVHFELGRQYDFLVQIEDDPAKRNHFRHQATRSFEAAHLLESEPGTRASKPWSGQLLRMATEAPESERMQFLEQAENVTRVVASRDGVPVTRVYNYACIMVHRGRRAEALASLRECVEASAISRDFVRSDNDWQSFKDDPEWLSIVEG